MKKFVLFSFALVAVGALSAQEFQSNTTPTSVKVPWVPVLQRGLYGTLVPVSSSPWENTIGNWGMDDGVGEMTETADDIWEIQTYDPSTYRG